MTTPERPWESLLRHEPTGWYVDPDSGAVFSGRWARKRLGGPDISGHLRAGWSLHGEIDTPPDKTPQATFDAWVKFLGLRLNVDGSRASGTCPANRDVPVGIALPPPT